MEFEKALGAIASALKTDATELSALLKNADGNGFLPEAEATKALGDFIKEKVSTARADQHARAKREVETAVEKRFKAAGFTNPDGLKGDELLAAAVEHFTTASAGEPATMTEADLAKLPNVKTLMQKAKADAEALNVTLKSEIEATKKQQAKDKGVATMLQIVTANKVALGEGDTRTARLDAIGRLVDFDRVQFGADGKGVMLDETGAVKTDGFGKPETFEAHVLAKAVIFGFDTRQNGNGGANPPAGGGAAGTGGSTITFENEAAYERFMRTETDGKKRLEAQKAWTETKKE